ncbi:MAG: hypothetical protein KDJ65_23630 [Anaerolineae bacterium]|nr:hypothetical protein [Anaerolineae bacterium]
MLISIKEMTIKNIVLIIVLIILLTACGVPAQPAPTPTATVIAVTPAPTAPPLLEPTVASPLPTPTEPIFESPIATQVPDSSTDDPISDRPVIELKRSGGFAGREETFVIYADGRIENEAQGTFQADPQALETLLSDAATDGFFDLGDSYLSRDPCCDRFTYELTLRHNGQEKSVTTIDDADNPPPALVSTLEAVNLFLFETMQ